jgi:formylglycine-generating enzyme
MNSERVAFGLRDGRFVELDSERGYRQVRPLVRNAKDGSVLVWIPGGEFEMGDDKDSDCPKHRVHLDGYYIGVYCVTNGQYVRFVEETGHSAPDNSRWNQEPFVAQPVVDVNWESASAYAKWAGCELPTEAQWEKSARGPLGSVYPWGDEWDKRKCRNDKTKVNVQTAPVYGYATGASGYGTYQQSGNVWEWCRDLKGDYETDGVQRNPTGPDRGSNHVLRGGCWRYDNPAIFRGVFRGWRTPGNRHDVRGFRLVRSLAAASSEGWRAVFSFAKATGYR